MTNHDSLEGPQYRGETSASTEARIISRLEALVFDPETNEFRDSPLNSVISEQPSADETTGYFEPLAPEGRRYYIAHDIEIQNRRGARTGRVTAYDVLRFRLPVLGAFTIYRQQYTNVDGNLGPIDWTASYTTWRGRIIGANLEASDHRVVPSSIPASDLRPMANGISHAADVLAQFAQAAFGEDILAR